MGFFSKLFGGDSILKNAEKLAGKAEALKAKFDAMSDLELRAKTDEHRKRAASGESLDDLLPEVFAQVRAASKRVLGMEHYHVQLVGGAVLHLGNIAEMKTGEGKTLVATLPACLNALTGSVHIVTVNDYLATRDSEWMGKLYKFLGYSVGLIVKDMDPAAKQAAYACDIIYATNNELGFDYLRDNMVIRRESMVQSTLNYAIIDEVDSILIDEARTPLIISGRGEKSTEAYQLADRFARRLKLDQDFSMDEKKKTINLTEKGVQAAEAHFGVENWADASNTEMSHHVNQALRAHYLMHRDVDYVVQNGEVVIVDEFTGRIMTGRRYSNGLHQAIEAKEGVRVERESKTLATITFQNFFRMYKKISGMTGTAKTEEDEFSAIYGLPVVQIPTNRPMVRQDLNDVIYPTVRAKFLAVIDEIAEVHKTGRPILVGTVSVEHSEVLSKLLSKRGVPHEVLNAKHHEKEAQIIAQAGKLGAVTIATNMAGRGTDILLGGNPDYMAHTDMRREGYEEERIYDAVSHAETDDPEVIALRQHYQELVEKHKKTTELEHKQVVAAGGLYIIGTERHESRRIDNQLRGRSGRQGDPGASKFYIALEDDLMRLFGGEKIKVMMERMKAGDDMPLEFGIMSKQIENAQKRIEERNFGIRKNVLEYDDVMNKQRTIIYDQRRRVLMGEDIHATVMDMAHDLIDELCDQFCPNNLYPEEWSIDALQAAARELFLPQEMELFCGMDISKLSNEQAKAHLHELAESVYAEREKELTEAGVDMRDAERVVLLRNVDNNWMRHIDDMDQLKQGVGLRAYGQRDPLVEFRMESYDMFDEMVHGIKEGTVKMLYHLTVRSNIQVKPQVQSVSAGEPQTKKPVKAGRKVGRNDPCPCGSGKKYKNCCGRN